MKRFFVVLLFLAAVSALASAHADDALGTSCDAPILSEISMPLWPFVALVGVFVLGAVGVGFGISFKKLPIAALGVVLLLASVGLYASGPGFNFKTGFFDKNIHYHADIQTYVYGKAVNFSEVRFQGTEEAELSGFVHFHDGNGHVIHLHASGVPLSYFFGSFGGVLSSNCLQVASGEPLLCTNATETLKFFVNGKAVPDAGSYQFQDVDKLLVSYGPTGEDVTNQVASVTNEACIASGKCPVPVGYDLHKENCAS